MKLSISLATLNGYGASASIITRGVFGGDLDIAGGTHTTPAEACAQAAAALRDAADRFDLLAKEEKPLQVSVQTRVNRQALPT